MGDVNFSKLIEILLTSVIGKSYPKSAWITLDPAVVQTRVKDSSLTSKRELVYI